ncbi:MAG: hypothetical protein R3D89_10155 [Sphingomonadaceae bacterium]
MVLGVPASRQHADADAAQYTLALSSPIRWPCPFWLLRPERAVIRMDRRKTAAHLRRMMRSGNWLAVGAFLRFKASTATVILVHSFVLGAYEAGLIRVAQTIVGLANPCGCKRWSTSSHSALAATKREGAGRWRGRASASSPCSC